MTQRLLSNILGEPDQPPNELKSLTDHQQTVADHICDKRLTITESAQALGIDRVNLYRVLRKPHVRQYIRQRLRSKLNAMAPRALDVMDSLLSDNDPHVRHKAARDILDRADIQPTEQSDTGTGQTVNIQINLGD